MVRSALLFLLAIGVSSQVSAVPVYVSTAGQFSSTDAAGQLVAPNGLFNLQFVVDTAANVVAGSSTTTGFNVPISNFTYALNGAAISAQPTQIRFNTLGNGGLFDVAFGTGLTAPMFTFEGAQAFSGTTTAPMFAIGTYSLTNWIYSDAINFDTQTPTNATVRISAVPEPSTLFLSLSGLGACFTAGIAKVRGRKSIRR